MKTLLLAFAIASCAVAPAHAADKVEAPKEMVVLTVGGEIGVTNRGPVDAKKDSLLAGHKLNFERAFAFDRPMLARLKQGQVELQPPEFSEPALFEGPLLKEVLAAVGAAHAKVWIVAMDGYQGYLEPEEVEGSDWILALSADGKPLGIGQQGPLWLLPVRAEGEQPSDDQRGHWVWAAFAVRVGE